MFKDVISRDNGLPWAPRDLSRPAFEMNTAAWLDVLPRVVNIGDYYLEDGHHRVVRAALNGETWITARLLRLDDRQGL